MALKDELDCASEGLKPQYPKDSMTLTRIYGSYTIVGLQQDMLYGGNLKGHLVLKVGDDVFLKWLANLWRDLCS